MAKTSPPTLTTPNPYLAGMFAPVREEVTATDLPVTGQLPPELNGRYLRIGPNPPEDVDPAGYHWFLGPGMVHGIRLRDGKAEWYRNRFVRGKDGQTPNTNVLAHGGRLLALVEAGDLPVAMAPDLSQMTSWDCAGALATGFTAHPKIDPGSGELHAITYAPMSPGLRYVVLDAEGVAAHSAEIPVDGFPMVHDMALTASRVVLLDLPVTLSLAAMQHYGSAPALSYGKFPFRWDDEHPSRVGVLPRGGQSSDVRWFDAPRCYAFHVLNAYDQPDGSLIVDLVRYDTVFRDELRAPADGPPSLARWTIDPALGTVSEQIISDRSIEFPRIDPGLVGRPHRYGWFAGFGTGGLVHADDVTRSKVDGFDTGPLIKVDTTTGGTTMHDYGTGRVSMEPAFVRRPGATAEDDGWIMSVVHDATTDRAELVVLDAADVAAAPVARVHLPTRVPYGFHGNWVPDADLPQP